MAKRSIRYGGGSLSLSVKNATGQMLNFMKLPDEVKKELISEFQDVAEGVYIDAYKYTPRRTGALQDNLELKFTNNKQAFEVGWDEMKLRADPRNTKSRWYAPAIEFGTERMEAFEPLFKAYNKRSISVKEEFAEAINRVLAKHSIK